MTTTFILTSVDFNYESLKSLQNKLENIKSLIGTDVTVDKDFSFLLTEKMVNDGEFSLGYRRTYDDEKSVCFCIQRPLSLKEIKAKEDRKIMTEENERKHLEVLMKKYKVK